MSEIALAFVLLIGAALCLKGLRQARQVDFGFNPDHVLTAGLRIGMNGYNKTTGTQFYRQLQQRLGELPQVEAAALASWFPLGLEGGKSYPVMVDGYVRPPGEDPSFTYARISPRYFDTLQIPLIAGRDFTLRDDADAPAVAIVNTAFARHFWPGQDAIGRTFGCNGRSHTIVGIAKTGKYRALDEAPRPFFYLPYLQGVPELDLNVCLRTRGDPAAIIEPARKILQTLDPGVEFWGAMPLKDHVQGTFFAQSTASGLLLFLGVLALALALMGVYAVMAYNVGQRTQEFGVRMALGARPHDVLRQVIRRGFVLSALGSAAGLLLALGVTRLLAGFLYGVSPFDPATFLVIPLLLMTCALAACWLPARRATKVDPMTALRAE
jgi:predicted permease